MFTGCSNLERSSFGGDKKWFISHGHVPGGGQARHPEPEKHPAPRRRVLAQPRKVLVRRRQHRVPPRLVETLHGVDVAEEALVTPGLQQFVSYHLAQGRGVKDAHLVLDRKLEVFKGFINYISSMLPACAGQFSE